MDLSENDEAEESELLANALNENFIVEAAVNPRQFTDKIKSNIKFINKELSIIPLNVAHPVFSIDVVGKLITDFLGLLEIATINIKAIKEVGASVDNKYSSIDYSLLNSMNHRLSTAITSSSLNSNTTHQDQCSTKILSTKGTIYYADQMGSHDLAEQIREAFTGTNINFNVLEWHTNQQVEINNTGEVLNRLLLLREEYESNQNGNALFIIGNGHIIPVIFINNSYYILEGLPNGHTLSANINHMLQERGLTSAIINSGAQTDQLVNFCLHIAINSVLAFYDYLNTNEALNIEEISNSIRALNEKFLPSSDDFMSNSGGKRKAEKDIKYDLEFIDTDFQEKKAKLEQCDEKDNEQHIELDIYSKIESELHNEI